MMKELYFAFTTYCEKLGKADQRVDQERLAQSNQAMSWTMGWPLYNFSSALCTRHQRGVGSEDSLLGLLTGCHGQLVPLVTFLAQH